MVHFRRIRQNAYLGAAEKGLKRSERFPKEERLKPPKMKSANEHAAFRSALVSSLQNMGLIRILKLTLQSAEGSTYFRQSSALAGDAYFRQQIRTPSLCTDGNPCSLRLNCLRLQPLTAPSLASASFRPWTGFLKSAIYGPLPSKSFFPGNPKGSGRAASQASPARQFH